MRKKTSRYILLLLWAISLCVLPLSAQRVHTVVTKPQTPPVKFYQGTSLGVEVGGVISYGLGSPILNGEVQLQTNLKNRFLPVVELGYGRTNAVGEDTNLKYVASAPYARLGMDYNLLFRKTHLPGYMYLGARIGGTNFSFDVSGPVMKDPNYGHISSMTIDYKGLSTKALWAEVVFGLRTKVYKGFAMGWAIRYKTKLSVTDNGKAEPWYIPGFGKNGSSSFNFTYSLIYHLPF